MPRRPLTSTLDISNMAEAEQKTAFDIWLGRVKILLEIIAIPIAAYWAFSRFAEGEAPSLEHRHDTQSYLNWFDSSASDSCLGQFGLTLKNIGKVSFEVDQVTARAWLTTPARPQEAVGYLSPAALRGQPPQFEKVITDQLVGRYAPDVSLHDDFVFVLKRTPGQFALLQVVANVKPNPQLPNGLQIEEYRWDYVCGEVKNKSNAKPKEK